MSQIAGSWIIDNTENLENMFEKFNVPAEHRKVPPKDEIAMKISVEGNTWEVILPKMNQTTRFELGKKITIEGPDHRKHEATFNLENNKLIQTSTYESQPVTVTYVINDSGKLFQTTKIGDNLATITYKRA